MLVRSQVLQSSDFFSPEFIYFLLYSFDSVMYVINEHGSFEVLG